MTLTELFADYQSLPEYSGKVLDEVNCVSLFGDKPINIAATRGSLEELALLVNYGADVNDPGEHGYRPLHNAVEQGKVAAVQWLLMRGADKNLKNTQGDTPLDLALMLDEADIADILRN
jgi:ankyrin repeat protein